jgi:hypothetical protein
MLPRAVVQALGSAVPEQALAEEILKQYRQGFPGPVPDDNPPRVVTHPPEAGSLARAPESRGCGSGNHERAITLDGHGVLGRALPDAG